MSGGARRTLLDIDAAATQKIRLADKPGAFRRLAILFAHSGDSWFWIVGLSLLWFFGDSTWRAAAITMLAGIIITAGIVFVIKYTVRRQRPEGDWGSIYRKTDPHSFPSGHAARAAMLAAVAIGSGLGWFALLLAVWAPLVILARVAMGVHYLSDVIAGAVIGIITGLIALRFIPQLSVLF